MYARKEIKFSKGVFVKDIKTIIEQYTKRENLRNHIFVYHYYKDDLFLFCLTKKNYEATLDLSVDTNALSQGVSLKDFCYHLDLDLFYLDNPHEKKYDNFEFNLRILKHNNEIIVVKTQLNRFVDENRQSQNIFFAEFTNVIDLIQKTDELDTTSSNFYAMLKHTTDFIFFKDAHHVMTASSDTLAIIAGHQKGDELVGKIDYESFPKEHADAYYKLEKEIYQGKLSQSIEIQPFVDEHGKEGWADNRKYAIKNSAGDIIGLFGVARIVTQNIQNQKKLKKQAQLLDDKNREIQYYLDIAQVIIMALDKNKNVIMINQKGAELLGYTKDEIIGKNFIDNFLPQGVRADVNQVGEEIIKNINTHDGKINPILTKNGEERLVLWKNVPLLDENNQSIGILTSGEDITDRVKQDKQFLIQRKHAQMGEMLAMIAHQWRQPLSAISSSVSLLKVKLALNAFNSQEFNSKLDNITEYTQHLSNTIDDFRLFFQDDKEKSEVGLNDIMDNSLEIILPTIQSSNITLTKNYLSDKKAFTYPNELKQVILNIIKNAQEAIDEREVKNGTIYLKTYSDDNWHILSIKDNAGGISEEILEKNFDPYFTSKGELNGTGLGLYMSKIIIEDHCHGKIFVENIDDGSQFTIKLSKRQ